MTDFLQPSVYWQIDHPVLPSLKKNTETDVVVVGGGMAGISAAHAFALQKKSVVLIEKSFCGSGASGRSSGFITPDSEINLTAFVERLGADCAKKIWEFAIDGCRTIGRNIQQFKIECDYQQQATLVVANDKKGMKELVQEDATRRKLGYESTLYDEKALQSVLASSHYLGGISYNSTFGINPYLYCQGMKNYLVSIGVKIYEGTPAISCGNNIVTTPHAQIKTKHIILCVDRFLSDLHKLTKDVYHAQTFVLVTERLNDHQVKDLFPGQSYLTWDTDLIYSYYRIIGENRFMIGGATLWCTYDKQMHYNNQYVVNKLTSYVKKKFPQFNANFEYFWPGLIGLTKDIAPIAGFDATDKSLYYITGAAGLPWAAALGYYAADRIVNSNTDFDDYFSPYRKYPIPRFVQAIIGTRATFALSNALSLH